LRFPEAALSASRPRASRGSAVLPGVVAIALLLLTFAGATNVIVDEYAKGALRTAVDEGAQAGAAAGGSVAVCLGATRQVAHNLLPGPFGAAVQLSCHLQGGDVVASAAGDLPSFVLDVVVGRVSVEGLSVVDTGTAP